jgi:very-short-patch-repair endonuclease
MPSVRWTPEQLQEWQQRQAKPKPAEKPANPAPKESKLERRFIQQLTDAGITGWQRNYFFLSDRDLEFDFAWPGARVAVEVQGMAHRIKANFQRDIRKRALALLAGWRVLEVDGSAIKSGEAMEWLKQLVK